MSNHGGRQLDSVDSSIAALPEVVEAVGGRIRFFVSGGAALPSEIALTFAGAGLIILQGYGLTETSPVVAVNRLSDNRFGTIRGTAVLSRSCAGVGFRPNIGHPRG